MSTLILSDKSDASLLGRNLKETVLNAIGKSGLEYRHFDVEKEQLNYCVGCFSCWVKTPGVCVFDDIGRLINREFVNSEAVLILSPVQFGCYSTAIRRILDRSIPVILPFFTRFDGEVHHAPRYERYPRLVIVGYGEGITDYEEATFKSLNDANALNFQSSRATTYLCRNQSDSMCIVQSVLELLQEKEA